MKRRYDMGPGTGAATQAPLRAAKRPRIAPAVEAPTAASVRSEPARDLAVTDLLDADQADAALARIDAGPGTARVKGIARDGAKESIAGLRRYVGAEFRGVVSQPAAFPGAVPRNDVRIASWNSTGLNEGKLTKFLGHCDKAEGGAMDLVVMQETNADLVDGLMASGKLVSGYRAVGRTFQGGSGGPYAVFCRDGGCVTSVDTWGLIEYPKPEMLKKLPIAGIGKSELVEDNFAESARHPPQFLSFSVGDHKAVDVFNCHLPPEANIAPSSLKLCSAVSEQFGNREIRDNEPAERDTIRLFAGDVNQSAAEARRNVPRAAEIASGSGEELCHVIKMPTADATLMPRAVAAFKDYGKAAGDGDHKPIAAVLEFLAKLY